MGNKARLLHEGDVYSGALSSFWSAQDLANTCPVMYVNLRANLSGSRARAKRPHVLLILLEAAVSACCLLQHWMLVPRQYTDLSAVSTIGRK